MTYEDRDGFDELAHVTRQLHECRDHEATLQVEVDRLHRLIDSAIEDYLEDGSFDLFTIATGRRWPFSRWWEES